MGPRTSATATRSLAWLTLALLIISAAVKPARADFMILTDPSQFRSGVTLITFDEGDFDGHVLSPFDVVHEYRGVGFRALGTPADKWPEAGFDPSPLRQFGPGGSAGGTIVQDLLFGAAGLEIDLPYPVVQFGAEFEVVTPGDFAFTLYSGTQQVDVVTIPDPGTSSYYRFHAFEDASAFDRVVIQGPGFDHPTSTDGRVVLDNLRFAPVPEPRSLALFAVSIVVVVLAARPATFRLRRYHH